MSQVNTVLGPIDSSELGFTLSHEHITLGAPAPPRPTPGSRTSTPSPTPPPRR